MVLPISLVTRFPELMARAKHCADDDFVVLDETLMRENPDIADFQKASVILSAILVKPNDPSSLIELSNSSAVVVSPDGLVLTAKHCVDDKDELGDCIKMAKEKYPEFKDAKLSFRVGIVQRPVARTVSIKYFPLKVIEQSDTEDIALAAIDDKEGSSFNSVPIKEGPIDFLDDTFCLGHPESTSYNVMTRGLALNEGRPDLSPLSDADVIADILKTTTDNRVPLFFLDPSNPQLYLRARKYPDILKINRRPPPKRIYSSNLVMPGNSGGPLCDDSGALRGIACLRHTRVEHEDGKVTFRGDAAGSYNSDTILEFLRRQVPSLDLNKLLAGEAVGVKELLDK